MSKQVIRVDHLPKQSLKSSLDFCRVSQSVTVSFLFIVSRHFSRRRIRVDID